MQAAGDGGEVVGTARVLVCTFTVEPQTFDLPVPKRECVGHGSRRIRCITWRALSKGRAYDITAIEGHGRIWTNAQLLHKWKVLPRTSRDRNQKSKMVAGNDGAPRTLTDN